MSSKILRQLSFRELEAKVPGLTKLNITIGAATGGQGHANTKQFVRRFLPSLKYSNPQSTFTVVKKAEPGTKSTIEAAFAGAGSKVFDPTAAKDVQLFAELLGREAPPLSSLSSLYSPSPASPAPPASAADAAPADATAAPPAAATDPFVSSILKVAKDAYRAHGSAGQGEFLYNKKKWAVKRAKLGLPPLKGRAKLGAGSSKA